MTVEYVIETVDKLYPNEFDYDDKIRWINAVDKDIWETLVKNYSDFDVPDAVTVDEDDDGNKTYTYTGYTAGDGSKKLIAPSMFNEMYISWMLAQIYLAREETAKYNNAVTIYNNLMYDFRAWYNRNHNKTCRNIKNYYAWGD